MHASNPQPELSKARFAIVPIGRRTDACLIRCRPRQSQSWIEVTIPIPRAELVSGVSVVTPRQVLVAIAAGRWEAATIQKRMVLDQIATEVESIVAPIDRLAAKTAYDVENALADNGIATGS